jgi:Ribonuclease G/E
MSDHDDDAWTIRDLKDRLDRDDVDGDTEALRAIATRIEARITTTTDPRSLLVDLGYTVHSIRDAVDQLAADREVDDPEVKDTVKEIYNILHVASGHLAWVSDYIH